MKAKTLKEIRKICRPRPLRQDQLEAYFIETAKARDPHRNPRKQIISELESLETGEDTRILFYGHRGCGKSTELTKLISEIGDQFITANFSVLDEMNLESASEKQLLIIVEDLDKLGLKQAREMYIDNTRLLTAIPANIIYTIPVFLFHSPDADAFKQYFDKIV